MNIKNYRRLMLYLWKFIREGNCFATRTKYICSDKCKNLYLKEKGKNIRANSNCNANNDDYLISLKINYGNPFKPKIKKSGRQE